MIVIVSSVMVFAYLALVALRIAAPTWMLWAYKSSEVHSLNDRSPEIDTASQQHPRDHRQSGAVAHVPHLELNQAEFEYLHESVFGLQLDRQDKSRSDDLYKRQLALELMTVRKGGDFALRSDVFGDVGTKKNAATREIVSLDEFRKNRSAA